MSKGHEHSSRLNLILFWLLKLVTATRPNDSCAYPSGAYFICVVKCSDEETGFQMSVRLTELALTNEDRELSPFRSISCFVYIQIVLSWG